MVYSREKGINYLAEYSKKYNTVEIDQWFWSLFGVNKVILPRAEVAREYAQGVPEDFLFTVKVPNSITLTHFYKKKKSDPLVKNPHFLSDELFLQFLECIEPLKTKLGPLMFQFEYLNKQKMPSAKEFIERLTSFIDKLPEDYIYGVEIRNANYFNEYYFSFLKSMNLAHVFLQGYYMPEIFPIYEKNKEYFRDCVIIRLHGPQRQDMEKLTGKVWDRIVAGKDTEINALLNMLKGLKQRRVNVFVNVNNHYEGSAPLTIRKIEDKMQIKTPLS